MELEKKGLVETIGIDWADPNFKEDPGATLSKVIEWADVFVFQYSNPSDILTRYNDLAISEKIPKLFVSEFDDDFTCVHPSNSYYRHSGIENVKVGDKWAWKDGALCDHLDEYDDKTDEEKKFLTFNILRNKARMAKTFRAQMYSDLITTTTPELAQTFTRWNENISVLPNYINPHAMPPGKKMPRDHVLIGWQGGDSHHHDLKMIMPALKRIKAKYKDKVHFRFMGAAFVNMYEEIGGEHIEWVDPYKFYEKFAEDLMDIGLVPLIDPEKNKFNNAKSNIKWLEYSHYAIPSVVSGYKPYVQHIEDGNTGIIAYTEEDWFQSLCLLIDDSLLRTRIGVNAKKEVDSKFSIQNHAMKWYDLYMSALLAKVESFSGDSSSK
jgi:glycosyltransferase involved in cell wall biosynthesis